MILRNSIVILLFYFIFGTLFAQEDGSATEHQCLKCHSKATFSFHNELMDTEMRRLMNPYFILDTIGIANGVHHNFDCTDCHSFEYTTYPHEANLKLEPMATCIDCHGGDETYASFQFDRIAEEAEKSVHHQAYGDAFTCSKCHDQHTYAPIARTSSNVKDIVEFSNKMCLSCHNNMEKFQLVSGRENPELVQVHNWLPNQQLHFQHVRCIECHTEVTDSLMVSHNILKKENAVRKCVECHTADSRLKASLYKYENLQARAADGSVNTLLVNESYVIGAQQSPILKLISIIVFMATLAGIGVHLVFRIFKK